MEKRIFFDSSTKFGKLSLALTSGEGPALAGEDSSETQEVGLGDLPSERGIHKR